MSKWATFGKAVAGGLVGISIGLVLWLVGLHLYQDHQNFHALIDLELRRAQAAQQQAAPPAK